MKENCYVNSFWRCYCEHLTFFPAQVPGLGPAQDAFLVCEKSTSSSYGLSLFDSGAIRDAPDDACTTSRLRKESLNSSIGSSWSNSGIGSDWDDASDLPYCIEMLASSNKGDPGTSHGTRGRDNLSSRCRNNRFRDMPQGFCNRRSRGSAPRRSRGIAPRSELRA